MVVLLLCYSGALFTYSSFFLFVLHTTDIPQGEWEMELFEKKKGKSHYNGEGMVSPVLLDPVADSRHY